MRSARHGVPAVLGVLSGQIPGRGAGRMGEPHCPACALAGFWTCDGCGEIVYDPVRPVVDGDELCSECVELLPGAE